MPCTFLDISHFPLIFLSVLSLDVSILMFQVLAAVSWISSFLQEAKPQPWNQTNGNLSTNISQSDLTSHRADSLTSSENILNSRAEIASQSNNSRVMSTSSLPLLENTGANSTNYPIISPSESNIGTPLQNSQEIVGHPVQLSPDSLGYPQYPQHITTHHVPAENIGYPPLFQPSPHEMEISQSAPPTQTSIPEVIHRIKSIQPLKSRLPYNYSIPLKTWIVHNFL